MDANAQTPGPEEVLRAFLLTRGFTALTGGDVPPRIVYGAVPPDFPVALRLPEDVRVLGTILSPEPHVLAETTSAEEDVARRLVAAMTDDGWRNEPFGPYTGGFVPTMLLRYGFSLLRAENEPRIFLMVYARPGGGAILVIALHPDAAMFISRGQRRRHEDVFAVLPTLVAPAGATQMPGGGGGGYSQSTLAARVVTDLDVLPLYEHYARQIAEQGWTPGTSGAQGNGAWGTWWRDDGAERRRLALLLLRWDDVPPRYDAFLACERLDGTQPPAGHGGWFSHAPLS